MIPETDHQPEMAEPGSLAALPADLAAGVGRLLGQRVSEIIAEVPGALELLIEQGFAPLAQPALRRVLAPSLTLSQALKLRMLPAGREQAVLRGLAELAGATAGGARCR